MTLARLGRGWFEPGAHGAVECRGLTADSRCVRPGWLFVALPYLDRAGFRHDGHDFIADAVARGAAAVVATDGAKITGCPVPVVLVDDTRWLLPRLAARWHGDPSRQLKLVGVTGTNGKTTTCYLLDDILRAAGHQTVLAGTVETRLADEVRPATTTTPDPVSLQGLWREAVDRGVGAGCMEVSSHALHQHRTDATRFEAAVFTNLTQDHLDYHDDLEDYFAAKSRLFAPDDQGRAPRAVVNADDPYGRRLLETVSGEPLSFGLEPGSQVGADGLICAADGSRFTLVTPAGNWPQALRIVGRYNVANALGAAAAALALGVDPEPIAAALARATGAPGRLQPVDEGQAFAVLVDYAHTPDALDNAIRAVRAICAGRVITLFGCGGDRDAKKRPIMGRVAAELSDLVVVTSDNPRTEPPDTIVHQIVTGIPAGTRTVVEVDRRAAIGLALAEARPGDVVLLAGKGHENYQILGEQKVHFDDREVAADWLRGHG